jgi:peptidoglycan biosynthesis protein MviN/MurJ (putative lipid II flippase)
MISGSISIFKFSLTLQAFPITIIGMSYAVASFPTLVEHFTKKEFTHFAEAIINPVRQIIFWSLPVIVLFVLLRAQIVRVVLGVGNFDWSDTRLVAASLAILVFGIVAQGIMNVLVRGYYAAGKTWRPLLINGLSTVVTIAVAYAGMYWYAAHPEYALFFARILRVANTNGVEVLILSLAYMLGTLFNGFVLWILFKREFLQGYDSISGGVINSIVASILLGITTYAGLQIFSSLFNLSTFLGVFAQMVCAGIAGVVMSGLFLYVREDEEFMRMWGKVLSMKSKFL